MISYEYFTRPALVAAGSPRDKAKLVIAPNRSGNSNWPPKAHQSSLLSLDQHPFQTLVRSITSASNFIPKTTSFIISSLMPNHQLDSFDQLGTMDVTSPPVPLSHRFTLELEFVLCLSNPQYLQYLAITYPHLLNKPQHAANVEDSDAACFARYLKYLYNYWRTPEYVQYLTHPGATLRNLELLQHEQFRKDVIRPDIIAKLYEMGPEATQDTTANATTARQEQEATE